MGDNRDNSKDSRASEVGFVPKINLIGKAQIIFSLIMDQKVLWIWKWHNLIRFSRTVRNWINPLRLKNLDYKFKDIELLNEALTHSSIKKNIKKRIFNYERLEFLGDRILGFIISDLIFKKFQNFQE